MVAMDRVLLYLAVSVAFVVSPAHGFSQGPPSDTCLTLFPHHDVEQQTGTAPYSLTFSPTTYTPGQNITVTVQSTSSAGFKGFQVIAHRVATSGNAEEFIGTFTPHNDTKMWAHRNSIVKTKVVATWTAPEDNLGDLEFFLSVVEERVKFWSNIPKILKAQTSQNVVPPAHRLCTSPSHTKDLINWTSFTCHFLGNSERIDRSGVCILCTGEAEACSAGLCLTVPSVAMPSQPIDWMTCGHTKACWMVPVRGQAACNGTDCQAALSFTKQGDSFIMEMVVKGADHYITVGFSEDMRMGEDQTVTCTARTNHESVQPGYNPEQYNSRELTVGISDLIVGQANGQAFCSFTREAALSTFEGNNKVFNLSSTPYYLFLAWGHIYDGTDSFGQHSETPAVTSNKINLALDPASMPAILTASSQTTTTDPTSAARPSHKTTGHLIGFLLACVILIM